MKEKRIASPGARHRRATVRHQALGLALLCALATSGCGTICHPERSLVPSSKRGGVDVVIVIMDILCSVPTFLVGLYALAGAGAGGPDAWKVLFAPLWIDSRQGTLWHPKEGGAE